jgi:hypothetical protein
MATITSAYEKRRGWAACFAVEKTEDWHPDFRGVVTLEDGTKCWVNVFKRRDRHGKVYVSVNLKPWEGGKGS